MAALLSYLIFIIAILLFIFWIRQFIDLMGRSDDSFSGKYDKPIWAAVLLLTFVIGALVYAIANLKQKITQPEDIKTAPKENPEPCLKCGKTIPPDAINCPFCGWSYQENK